MSSGLVLKLDPIACDAHAMCAELLPERISLDDWGYPIIDGGELTPELLEHARRAVAACPTLALRLQRQSQGAAGRSVRGVSS